MAEPVFATKWHFFVADVLFGVHEVSGELLLVTDAAGAPAWMCWTDPELARRQVPPGYVLRHGPAREALAVLPAGVGVVVDPTSPGSLTLSADYVEQLRPQLAVFPAGVQVSFEPWEGLPSGLVPALAGLGEQYAFLRRLWLLRFRIEDGPWQGLVVYDAEESREVGESVVEGIARVLDTHLDLRRLTQPVAAVQVLALTDLPAGASERVRELSAVSGHRTGG